MSKARRGYWRICW